MGAAGRTSVALAVLVAGLVPGVQAQQRSETTVFDSIAVVGANRQGRSAVLSRINIALGQPIGFLDVQRAIEALYATGQFADIQVLQATVDGVEILQFRVVERPLMIGWDLRGASNLSERSVRGKIRLLAGRPYTPADVAAPRAAIDSLYQKEGYYQTRVEATVFPQEDGRVRLTFDVTEGSRVAISRIIIEGNEAFAADEIVSHMSTKPEGFLWFKKGEYDELKIERDVRERLPAFYASRGYIDFQVLRDTLVINESTGKATLIVSVDEGDQYKVGTFEILGNREFTRQQLEQFYPFGRETTGGFLGIGGGGDAGGALDATRVGTATAEASTLDFNNGYIYAQVRESMSRRTGPDGEKLVDLRWNVIEGAPAIVNRIHIVGNTITHESIIRRAIFMVPGDVFRQDALIQSYQALSHLGFFEHPFPTPTTPQQSSCAATALATTGVPAANESHSKTPLGPFQMIVFAAAISPA